MLAHPAALHDAAALEAEHACGRLKSMGENLMALHGTDYFAQHREAALKALNIFALGSA